jgi:hypothetical protein
MSWKASSTWQYTPGFYKMMCEFGSSILSTVNSGPCGRLKHRTQVSTFLMGLVCLYVSLGQGRLQLRAWKGTPVVLKWFPFLPAARPDLIGASGIIDSRRQGISYSKKILMHE